MSSQMTTITAPTDPYRMQLDTRGRRYLTGSLRRRSHHRVGDRMEPVRLAHVQGGTVVHLPAVGTGAVEVAQVVEALVGAPTLGATGEAERGVPVHELVHAEAAGGPVLQPGVLPYRHPAIVP